MNITSLQTIQLVRELSQSGVLISKISRDLALDRGTVRKYVRLSEEEFSSLKHAGVIQSAEIEDLKSLQFGFESQAPHHGVMFPNMKSKYSYLLGIYLSDGYVSHHARTKRLIISLGSEETNVLAMTAQFLKELFPKNKVSLYPRKEVKCMDVSLYNKGLSDMFPGAEYLSGPKHLKHLEIRDWQIDSIKMYPREFILGSIHGDGCRYLSCGKYLYYNFTNLSLQIKELFVMACRLIGIEFYSTFDVSKKRIQIYKKSNIAILESFWVPK